MLTYYRQQTRKLLSDQQMIRFNEFDLISWINTGRSQVALESATTKQFLNFTLPGGQNTWSYSAFTIPGGIGLQSVAVVRQIFNPALMEGRPWGYFAELYLGSAATGTPTIWSQFNQGPLGQAFFYPRPTVNTSLSADVVCLPIALAADTDVEAIPAPWTDAIPYFAAYLGYLSIQDMQSAGNMMTAYEAFANRGTKITTPSILPGNFEGREGVAAASLSQTLVGMPQMSGGRGGQGGGNGGSQ